MTIGEKIRHYRLEKNMTQEKLAEELSLSFQAISKWERNESLPDVTIISRLSQILGVSCDALLTDHNYFQEIETENIMKRLNTLDDAVYAEYCEKISLLENALEKYPSSMELAAVLAELYSKCRQYPEYTGDDYPKRAVKLYQHISANASDPKLKYQAVQMLCYLYRAEGNYDLVRKLAESMPELYQSRPALLCYSMPGSQIKEGIQDYILQLLNAAESMRSVMASMP